MRISDWSSDVCSSDLWPGFAPKGTAPDELWWASPGPRARCRGGYWPPVHRLLGEGRGQVARAQSMHVVIAGNCASRAYAMSSSAERREGQECVSTWRYLWVPYR